MASMSSLKSKKRTFIIPSSNPDFAVVKRLVDWHGLVVFTANRVAPRYIPYVITTNTAGSQSYWQSNETYIKCKMYSLSHISSLHLKKRKSDSLPVLDLSNSRAYIAIVLSVFDYFPIIS
jgi:hypothetical protein